MRLWWLIHKDVISECRAKQAWPGMLLLGLVVAVVFTAQMGLLPDQKTQISGAMLWLALFFAGLLSIDRSCAAERDDECWEGLLAYPISPALVYWSKYLFNVLALSGLECLLVPVFVALSGVELLSPPWPIAAVCLAANLGFAAVGTFLSAVANRIAHNGQLLVLLLLPLMIPVVIAAAEATRLIALESINEQWWRWLQLLAGYAVIFTTAGTILFEFVADD